MDDKNYKFIGIIVLILILAGLFWWSSQKKTETVSQNVPNSDMLAEAPAAAEVSGVSVEYGQGVTGFYASPKEPGNYPGVVMIHEWWGLNQNIKDMALELAKKGYQVVAVDLYKGKVATTQAEAQMQTSSLVPAEAVKNMQDAVAYLKSKGADKIASLGWCFGGGQSLQLALSGEKLDATVIYYGGLVADRSKLAAIKWPVLGIFGDKDTSISVDSVNQFKTSLDALGVSNSINIYNGVGHAFANPTGMNYAPVETKDAWAKTLAFLNQNLK